MRARRPSALSTPLAAVERPRSSKELFWVRRKLPLGCPARIRRVFRTVGSAARLVVPASALESKIKALKIHENRFKGTDPLKNA